MAFAFVATKNDSGRKLIGHLPSKLSPCRPNVFLDFCMVSFIENYLATPGDPLDSKDYQIRKDLELALKKYEASRAPTPPRPQARWENPPVIHENTPSSLRPFHGLFQKDIDAGDYRAAVTQIHSLNLIPMESRQLPHCTECACCYPPRFDSVNGSEFRELYNHIRDEQLLDLAYESNPSSLEAIPDVATIISRDKGPDYLSKLNINSCAAGTVLSDCLSAKIIKDVGDFVRLIPTKPETWRGIPKTGVYLAALDAAFGKPAEAGSSLQGLTPQEQTENRDLIQILIVTSLLQNDCNSEKVRDAYRVTGLQDNLIVNEKTYGLDHWQYLEVQCMVDKGNYLERLQQMTDEKTRTAYAEVLALNLRRSDKYRPINFTPLELLPFADVNGRKEIYKNFVFRKNAVVDEKTRADLKEKLLETDKYFVKGQYDEIILPYLRIMVALDPDAAEKIWETHKELYANDDLVVGAAQIFAQEKAYRQLLQLFFLLPVERRKELASQILSLVPPDLIDVQPSDIPDQPAERAKLYGVILEKEYGQYWHLEKSTPAPSNVSRYLYKSKNPIWIYTCKIIGFGCG